MKRFIISALSTIVFCNPVAAQTLNLSDREVKYLGKELATFFCAAVNAGYYTTEELAQIRLYMNNPRLEYLFKLSQTLQGREKKLFYAGTTEYVSENCYYNFRKLSH